MSSIHDHDASRKHVSRTAFAVARCREGETARGIQHGALIEDPFAHLFRDEESDKWWEGLVGDDKETMYTGIAVRSRHIDDELLDSFRDGLTQVVVVGAGLDCRPWRLKSLVPSVSWYEVDFKEVLDYKLGVLRSASGGELPPSPFDYRAVPCNVATEKVVETLLRAGYDAEKPTVWVLEGFTGYLEEEELRQAMESFTSHSAMGSRLVATVLGIKFTPRTSMHRFFTDEPMEFLTTWGWKGHAHVLGDLAVKFGRSPAGWTDYYIACARL